MWTNHGGGEDGSAPTGHAIRAAVHLLRPRPALVACAWHSAAHALSVATLASDGVARKGVAALDDASRGLAGSHARDAAAQRCSTAEEIARHAGRPVLLVAPPVGED